ncbi:hypothetical protein FNF27_02932 [Cafeteria roenbergensis]|uniref:Kinesin-like protein KIN-8B n=1 Tax=Cafeteria roenbergensis TaxID=33653 RepID=A0A5A8EDC1_CAFRO|nr:hypothetical protein FNF27_02932 [Cafeteria roenbergensis]
MAAAIKKSMWAGKSNILVCVRVRPLWEREGRSTVEVVDGKVVVCRDPGRAASDVLRKGRSRERQYAFDHAFGPEVPTARIYAQTTAFLLDGVMSGYNATVLAYGATGSGKTFTMLGTTESPGIMLQTLKELYERVSAAGPVARRPGAGSSGGGRAGGAAAAAPTMDVKVTLSYVEIYNENIRDLLAGGDDYLDLREDPVRGPQVAGVAEFSVDSPAEVMELLATGNRNRTQEATAANKESSRSHAVLQIVVEQKELGGDQVRIGKLTMLDLAGSERASNTQNRGIRLREGANINRSLLALGNVINALGSARKGSYIPYRDSKLTRLLKDSLGGNCRTVMIAAISPAARSFEETLNTLKYADRAKKIKTKVTRNVLRVNYHISQYEELIGNLRGEIATLQHRIAEQGDAEGGHPAAGGPASSHRGVSEVVGFSPRAVTGGSLRSPAAASPGSLRSGSPRKDPAGGMGATDSGDRAQELRGRLVGNFRERMQLRRALIDLEAVNAQNRSEISRKQLDAARAEHSAQVDRSSDSSAAARHSRDKAAARSTVEKLRATVATNSEAKRDLLRRLKENESEAKELRTDIEAHSSSRERRDLLDLQYRVGVLELENMELEHSRMLHAAVLRRKDLELRRLRLQIRARDRLIAQQADVITSHGLAHLVDFAAVAAIDNELRLSDGDDDDEEEEDDDDDEDDEEDRDDDEDGGSAASGALSRASKHHESAGKDADDDDDIDAGKQLSARRAGIRLPHPDGPFHANGQPVRFPPLSDVAAGSIRRNLPLPGGSRR